MLNVRCTYKFSNFLNSHCNQFSLTHLFQGVYFVIASFSKVLKLVFQMMSFQKLVSFVALMVLASQGAMAAPQPYLDLGARTPGPPPYFKPAPKLPRGDVEN